MKHWMIALLGMTFAVSTLAEGTQELPTIEAEKVGMSSQRLERITALGERYVENNQVAGIVNLVMRNGKVVHFTAHGQKGAEDKRPLQKDDLFRIYSMTKPITACLLYTSPSPRD